MQNEDKQFFLKVWKNAFDHYIVKCIKENKCIWFFKDKKISKTLCKYNISNINKIQQNYIVECPNCHKEIARIVENEL